MRPILTTDRLAFHPFTVADLSVLVALHRDPEVMRFLSIDGRPWSMDELRQKLARFVREQASLGFSKWKVCLRDGETVIGRAGFSIFEPTGEIELGFVFDRDAWGKGYATECSKCLLAWLFASRPDIDRVIAFVQPGNLASRRVLEKIGMKADGTRPVDGMAHAFYRSDQSDWRR
ncbi:GNAT family N-acetyltransferase [Enhydrobacter sp.]|uniref:GNAT family N-acetyltransferase n=1 Tax=Enhydrobacter sp. TaxID=1894999 RepID=UPI00261F7C99|nr:GNAT family N-acetyltransferase [Enhydrobacter sp.]